MPDGVKGRCLDCRSNIVGVSSYWREVVGFEQQRSGGGTNHLAARRPTGRVICESCLVKRKAGIAPGQEGLGI